MYSKNEKLYVIVLYNFSTLPSKLFTAILE